MKQLRRLIGRSSTLQNKNQATPTPAEYLQEQDDNAEGDNSTPQLTNEYFKRYELMTEL